MTVNHSRVFVFGRADHLAVSREARIIPNWAGRGNHLQFTRGSGILFAVKRGRAVEWVSDDGLRAVHMYAREVESQDDLRAIEEIDGEIADLEEKLDRAKRERQDRLAAIVTRSKCASARGLETIKAPNKGG